MTAQSDPLVGLARLLCCYFDNDSLPYRNTGVAASRFQMERRLGNGADGMTWLFKYEYVLGFVKRIVLKHDAQAARYTHDFVETDEDMAHMLAMIESRDTSIGIERQWLIVSCLSPLTM